MKPIFHAITENAFPFVLCIITALVVVTISGLFRHLA